MLKFNLTIVGAQALQNAIRQAPSEILSVTSDGANELTTAIWTVTTTPPALNSGNMPPTPYWVRGKGRVVNRQGRIDRPSYQYSGNIRHVTRELVATGDGTSLHSESSVPYAAWVSGGKTQARAMRNKGWKNLDTVAQQKYKEYVKNNANLTTKIVSKLSALFGRR